MFSVAVLEPLRILVGKFTVLGGLYIANRLSNCFSSVMSMKVINIYIPTDD